MAYCIYLRKSRKDMEAEARGEGETLARHKRTLTDLAAQRHLPVAEIYAEIVSGETIAERPEMRRMLAAIESGAYEGVICMDIDRLGRGDGADQARILKTLKFTHTLVITLYDTYDPWNSENDEESLECSQHFARMEYRHIKRRLWAGRVAAARTGKWMSPRAPYGYVKASSAEGFPTLAPVSDEANIVCLIFDWYGSGQMGLMKIASTLSKMGLKTHLGNQFTRATLRQMLQNPTYLGKIRWCYRRYKTAIKDGIVVKTLQYSDECMLFEGLHPAIITQAQWDAAQAQRARSQSVPCKSSTELRNPLAGLLYCSHCGYAMQYLHSRYDPLNNRGYICRTHGCPTCSCYSLHVLAVVRDALEGWASLSTQPEEQDTTPKQDPRALRIAAAQSALDALLTQRIKLQELVEAGAYTIPVYIERNTLNEERIKAATAELDEAKQSMAPEEAIKANHDKIAHVLDVWEESTPAELNVLLKQIISRITYTKDHQCTKVENPIEYLTLDIYPRINQ